MSQKTAYPAEQLQTFMKHYEISYLHKQQFC